MLSVNEEFEGNGDKIVGFACRKMRKTIIGVIGFPGRESNPRRGKMWNEISSRSPISFIN
jgi:hypothetical protein